MSMTLKEFGDWAYSQDSVGNPDVHNSYKGQCVSLIQQYLYQVFGNPFKAYGNAKDWENNYPSNFTKLKQGQGPKAGDIMVYSGAYPGSDGYGHIALIDCNGRFLEQNGKRKLAVSYQDYIPTNCCVAVLRPNDQSKLGLNQPQPTPAPFTAYTVRVTVDALNIRAGAGTNYKTTGCIRDRGVYTIVERRNNWGKLKSGLGWICLDYTKKA